MPNYDKLIENASSVGELKAIESQIERDSRLDPQYANGLITYSIERRYYDFGDLLDC